MPMLEKWVPLPDLDVVERRMRRLFDDAGLAPMIAPAADVYEAADEIVVELDVPGYDRERKAEKSQRAVRVRERLESHFERRFQLPTTADGGHVHAEYAKGVLTLHVPKIAGAEPRTVAIEAK